MVELTGDIQLANIDWRNRSASLAVGIAKKNIEIVDMALTL
jgi:hypothetical protein